jgi:hypothetical protein
VPALVAVTFLVYYGMGSGAFLVTVLKELLHYDTGRSAAVASAGMLMVALAPPLTRLAEAALGLRTRMLAAFGGLNAAGLAGLAAALATAPRGAAADAWSVAAVATMASLTALGSGVAAACLTTHTLAVLRHSGRQRLYGPIRAAGSCGFACSALPGLWIDPSSVGPLVAGAAAFLVSAPLSRWLPRGPEEFPSAARGLVARGVSPRPPAASLLPLALVLALTVVEKAFWMAQNVSLRRYQIIPHPMLLQMVLVIGPEVLILLRSSPMRPATRAWIPANAAAFGCHYALCGLAGLLGSPLLALAALPFVGINALAGSCLAAWLDDRVVDPRDRGVMQSLIPVAQAIGGAMAGLLFARLAPVELGTPRDYAPLWLAAGTVASMTAMAASLLVAGRESSPSR